MGTWCTGITPAQHAGGPGFNPQRVHMWEGWCSRRSRRILSSESKLTRRKQLFCLDVSFVYLRGAVSRSALRLPGLRFCCWIFWANESAFAALPTMKQADMQSSLGIFQNNFAYSECMAFGSHETFDALMRSSFGIVQDNLAYSGCTAFDNHSIFACKYAKFTRHITI